MGESYGDEAMSTAVWDLTYIMLWFGWVSASLMASMLGKRSVQIVDSELARQEVATSVSVQQDSEVSEGESLGGTVIGRPISGVPATDAVSGHILHGETVASVPTDWPEPVKPGQSAASGAAPTSDLSWSTTVDSAAGEPATAATASAAGQRDTSSEVLH